MKVPVLFLFLLCCISIGKAQVNGNFMFEGNNRSYIVYTPSSYVATNSYPLVFVLHGFTQTASDIMNFSGFNSIAETNQFIVVYANGLNVTWNATIGGAGANDAGFLMALFDTIKQNYSINPGRVYSCGFSMGGFMSHRLACEYSQKFTAIASVSGTMANATYAACSPSRSVPVLQIHGTADFVVSYSASTTNKGAEDMINFWTTEDFCPTTAILTTLPDLVNEGSTVERFDYSPCVDNSKVHLLKITNGGHTWPSALSLSGLGNLNQDINASQEIWNFFAQFTLPTSVENMVEQGNSVYPNPVMDDLYFRNSHVNKIQILNTLGQLINEQVVTNNKVSLKNLISGSYIARIYHGKQQFTTIRIFKK